MSTMKAGQSITGLSAAEAQQRLATSGYNELNPPRPHRLWHSVADALREPMFLLLIVAGVIYLLLGDFQDALMLLFFVVLIIVMTVSQQHKSRRVLEALRDLSSPRALVIRDGRQQRIAGREVVPGDLMLLKEGDRVAADAVLLSCNDLSADESMLTGESVPVRKQPGSSDSTALHPGGDDQPFAGRHPFRNLSAAHPDRQSGTPSGDIRRRTLPVAGAGIRLYAWSLAGRVAGRYQPGDGFTP
jgi:Ca2+-transporting ATPase